MVHAPDEDSAAEDAGPWWAESRTLSLDEALALADEQLLAHVNTRTRVSKQD
jgi:hypothetical protein